MPAMLAPTHALDRQPQGEGDRPRYRCLERIGAGGADETFLAIMECAGGTSRPVALKRLCPLWADNSQWQQQFLAGAQLSLRLHHPNLVHAYELGQDEDGFFLAL